MKWKYERSGRGLFQDTVAEFASISGARSTTPPPLETCDYANPYLNFTSFQVSSVFYIP